MSDLEYDNPDGRTDDVLDVTKFVGEHYDATVIDEVVTLLPVTEPCTVCGLPLAVGQQGCIIRIVPHEPVPVYHPFIAYFDLAMGEQIDSHGQRMRMMRGEKNCDGDEIRPRLEYRDHVSRGEQSARHDRIRERQKAEGRR